MPLTEDIALLVPPLLPLTSRNVETKENWKKTGFWQLVGLWKPWRKKFKESGGRQTAGMSRCQGTGCHRTNGSHVKLEN